VVSHAFTYTSDVPPGSIAGTFSPFQIIILTLNLRVGSLAMLIIGYLASISSSVRFFITDDLPSESMCFLVFFFKSDSKLFEISIEEDFSFSSNLLSSAWDTLNNSNMYLILPFGCVDTSSYISLHSTGLCNIFI